jgi:hypothetical protein
MKSESSKQSDRIKVPLKAPLLFRLFGKKAINLVIDDMWFATCLINASLYNKSGLLMDDLTELTIENATAIYKKNGDIMCRMLANSIINSRIRGYLFTGLLASYIKFSIKPLTLIDLTVYIVINSGAKEFIDVFRTSQLLTVTSPTYSNV